MKIKCKNKQKERLMKKVNPIESQKWDIKHIHSIIWKRKEKKEKIDELFILIIYTGLIFIPDIVQILILIYSN